MNTAITTLPERPAVCDEFDQAAAEADRLTSPQLLQVGAFLAWLERADPGASVAYHRGFLIRDRSPESHLPKDDRRTLTKVANAALNAAERGQVHLVQRREGELDFSYLAIRTGRAPTAQLQSDHPITTSQRPG